MACWLYPYQSFRGNAVWGQTVPGRGLLHNIHIDSNEYEPLNPILSWTHTQNAGQLTADNCVRVYAQGDLERTVYSESCVALGATRPGKVIKYDLEAVSIAEDSIYDSSAGFYARPIGDRAKLSWTQCTAADFGAYLVYWDAGVGGTPSAIYSTIYGSNNISLTTEALTEGTSYQFALAMKDVYGNAGTQGTAYSITIDSAPKELTGCTIVYNDVARTAAISATHPTAQSSDVVGVALYDNYIPGIGLDEYPNVDYQFRRQFIYDTTGVVTATTQQLHAGQWRFALRAVDKYGNESDYETKTLNLSITGSTLGIASTSPLMPENVSAHATASAAIVIEWDHDGSSVSEYQVYRGATSVGSVTGSNLTYTDSGLSDGTYYLYRVRAFNGGVGGDYSAYAGATADGSAPTGSRALTLELTI